MIVSGGESRGQDRVSDFLVKGDFTFVEATTPPGLAFTSINFDLSNAPETWIDSIEMNVFADTADDPNLLFGTLNIYRNVTINPDQLLVDQLAAGGIQTFWAARTKQVRDHNFDRQFASPLKLDRGFRYAVVGTFSFSAPLATTVQLQLFVGARTIVPKSDSFLRQR